MARVHGARAWCASSHADLVALSSSSLFLHHHHHHLPPAVCQCNVRADRPLRASKVPDTPPVVDALFEWVQSSDYYRLTGGQVQAGPGQFRELTRDELARCCASGEVIYHGASGPTNPAAVAILGKGAFGPNPVLRFIAGVDDAAVDAMLDDLRSLIPTEHPRGPSAVEVFGYLPVGCSACRAAADRRPLPSADDKAVWYCPRETLQLALTWKAGSL